MRGRKREREGVEREGNPRALSSVPGII